MSSEEQTPAAGPVPEQRKLTDKEALFFVNILGAMKNKPEVDWDLVAERTGYNSGTTAKVRYGQIKRAIGIKEYGTIERAPAAAKPRAKKVDENGNPIVTPRKPRAKKEKEVGSGTNKTPSKVTKAHTSKSKLSPAKVNDEDAEGDNDELAGSPGDDPFAVKAQAGAGEMFIDAPYEQQS